MTANWHVSADDWRVYFTAFPKVVLVANNDAADISGLRERHGEEALYVFFNKAYKVLSSPFEGRALLVARSSPAGANIVYRKEVSEVLACFAPGSLDGILNLICGGEERPSPPSDFGGPKVGWFHAEPVMAGFYPGTHLPTSGFALAVFLALLTLLKRTRLPVGRHAGPGCSRGLFRRPLGALEALQRS